MSYELEVSKKSFWARYEGLTTCNARGVYLLIALAATFAVGIVTAVTYNFVTDFWETLKICGLFIGVSGFFGLLFTLEKYNCEHKIDRALNATIDNKWVRGFFYYGFIWLWFPILALITAVVLIVRLLNEQIVKLFAFIASLKDKRVMDDEMLKMADEALKKKRLRYDEKEKREAENRNIREKFLDQRWAGLLVHTLLIGVVGGNTIMYFAPPRASLWIFPFAYAGWCILCWIVSILTVMGIGYIALPICVRYTAKNPIKDMWVSRFAIGFKQICADLYHKVCRPIVVNDYQFAGLAMRRIFSEAEINPKLTQGAYRVLLFSERVSKCKETAWKAFVRNDDEEAKQEFANRFPGSFCVQEDGKTVVRGFGYCSFLDFYKKCC